MDSPFVQPAGQITQQLKIPGRLPRDVEGEAVQEVVVDDRQSPLPHGVSSWLQPDPHRETVLGGQPQGQVEDVVASSVGQAVKVQVGGRESHVSDGIDLRPELHSTSSSRA